MMLGCFVGAPVQLTWVTWGVVGGGCTGKMAFQATLCWVHAVGHNHSGGLSACHADMDCAQVCRPRQGLV